MNEGELNIYSTLPNKVTIYRGIQGNKYYKALSWTLSKDKARWFSKRFTNNGTLFKAEIE